MTDQELNGRTMELTDKGVGARSSPVPTAQKFVLAAVLLLAAWLRLEHVKDPLIDSFSWREASTAMMAENLYLGRTNILVPLVNWAGPDGGQQGREFQLYTFLVSRLYSLFGIQEVVGRSLAAVCGIASTFLLFLLTRHLWNANGAVTCAAVYACLPGAVFIDQSFLPDPLMLTLVLASAWLATILAERPSRSLMLALTLVL